MASSRSGIAAAVLLLFLPTWRRWWEPRALAVGIAYAMTLILYVLANKLTTAANAIFLQGTAPLYLLLLGPLLLREPTRRSDLAFTGVLLAGMALFFAGTEPAQATAPDPLRGNLLAALSGISWALTVIGLRWLGRGAHPASADAPGGAVIAGNLIACLVCLPSALPFIELSAADGLIVLYLGTFQIGLAYVFLTGGVRRVPALETSLLLLLEPVLNAILSWLVHAERPGPWSLGGCAMVFCSTLGIALRRRP